MKTCVITLKSLSPMAQSRFHNSPSLEGELPDGKEERTWQLKAHTDAEGNIFVPPMAIAGCIKEAAKFLNKKVPGKGHETWTKRLCQVCGSSASAEVSVKNREVKSSSVQEEVS